MTGNRTLVAILLFVAWTIFAGVVGYQVRDGKADAHEARAETKATTGVLATTQQARATDHANASSAAHVEANRVDAMQKHETNFHAIDQEVEGYAHRHGGEQQQQACGNGGDAGRSADFVRVWNAASAGRPSGQDAGPDHPAGAAPGTGTAPGAAAGQ